MRIEIKIKGHLRPNLLVTYPNTILPQRQPKHNLLVEKKVSDFITNCIVERKFKIYKLAIQLASSIVILPDGSGDSSEVSRNIDGLGQPKKLN